MRNSNAAYNILNAREVEMVLRRIITGAFKRSDGTIDEVARQRAIDGTASDEGGEVTGKTGYKRFADALTLYLEQQSTAGVMLVTQVSLGSIRQVSR